MFGYTVGKTEGWSQEKRERFLGDFIELELPKQVSDIFGDEYGLPLTTNRLKKVADILASHCQLRYRNDPERFAIAISDWESDLAFLKRKYYEGMKLKFVPWPDPRGR